MNNDCLRSPMPPFLPHRRQPVSGNTLRTSKRRLSGRLYAIWLIFVFFVAACDVLEEDISARRIRIVGPADRAETLSGVVEFRWDAVAGASDYELTIATPSLSTGCLVVDTTVYADTLVRHHYGCRAVLEAGEYEWIITAFNSGYATCSEVRRLFVFDQAATTSPTAYR